MFLVIGYGNPLRGDDALAWRVLDRMERAGATLAPKGWQPRGVQEAEVRFLRVCQLTPELAETVSGAEGLVLVDATMDGDPGELQTLALASGPPGSARPEVPATTSHSLSPSLLLEYSRRLYGRSPKAVLLTVAGERFDLIEGLSPVVERSLPRVVLEVRSILESWRCAAAGDAPTSATCRCTSSP